jgi:F1F0 ATPase subunit 2
MIQGHSLFGLGGYLFFGLLAGGIHFHGLWWTTRLFAEGGRRTATVMLMLGRLILLGGLLAWASLEGAMPLLLMAVGVFAARVMVVRRLREATP